MIKKCCMCFLFAGLVIVAAGAVQASQIFYDAPSIQNEGGVPFNGLNGAAQGLFTTDSDVAARQYTVSAQIWGESGAYTWTPDVRFLSKSDLSTVEMSISDSNQQADFSGFSPFTNKSSMIL
ncbi:MAG: hypothetical protein ACLQBD_22285 [Syntrophobacteraceae bacterium]